MPFVFIYFYLLARLLIAITVLLLLCLFLTVPLSRSCKPGGKRTNIHFYVAVLWPIDWPDEPFCTQIHQPLDGCSSAVLYSISSLVFSKCQRVGFGIIDFWCVQSLNFKHQSTFQTMKMANFGAPFLSFHRRLLLNVFRLRMNGVGLTL